MPLIILRRLSVALVIALLLGVATATAVAFACAYWSEASASRSYREKRIIVATDFEGTTARDFGVERVLARRSSSPFDFRNPPALVEGPAWIDIPGTTERPYLRERELIGAGWPHICFRAHTDLDLSTFNPLEKEWHGGIVIETGLAITPFSDRVIPYAPVWRGLALNTLTFAAASFVLFGSLTLARAARRYARGQCFNCGYDLRAITSNVCPECGRSARWHGPGSQSR